MRGGMEPAAMVNSETGWRSERAGKGHSCAVKRGRRIARPFAVEIFRTAGGAGRQGPLAEVAIYSSSGSPRTT